MMQFTSLQIMSCCFKMHWLIGMWLYCVIINKQWHSKIIFHLQEPRQFARWWWMYCHQLWLVVFWIKTTEISCLGTLYNLWLARPVKFMISLLMWLSLTTWVIQRQMLLMQRWQNWWFTWSIKSWKFFNLSSLCMVLIRIGGTICWCWCEI